FKDRGASAILLPTTLTPAVPIGQTGQITYSNGGMVSFTTAVSRNISPGSTAGLPGLVIPSGLTRTGLPVSLELDGPAGADRELLSLGLAIEAILGHLPPPRL
ncbi:MAG: amidase family protein, partial [Alphaproteobacteria bacterium]